MRPFTSKAEAGEGPSSCFESRVDFSLADIDIFPKEAVQPKLVLGPAGDQYELVADCVARRVVQTIYSPDHGHIQREDVDDEDELDLGELEEEAAAQRQTAYEAPSLQI